MELIGSGSIFLAFVAIVGYLLKQNHADRKQNLEHVTAMEARYEKRLAAATEDAEEQRAAYDVERQRRMGLEDELAEYKRLDGSHQPGGGKQ